jgi:hypothetical protein
VVEEGQEGLVGWLAETGVKGSEVFKLVRRRGVATGERV